jgi:lysozyme
MASAERQDSLVLEFAATLVKEFEGCRLVAYRCPAGVWTIGWGHTGPEVTEGLTITQAKADEYLEQDLGRVLAGVDRLVTTDLTVGQTAALVSFAYNVGLGALKHSTLLRLLNTGATEAAAAEFPRWNRAAGRVLPGLVRRRAAEMEMFLERNLES